VYTASDMATKTKPKGKRKGKLKQAKRSGATLKKRSKGQSTSKQSRSLTRTKKISRRPRKPTRSKAVSRKERSTVVESTPSLGPTTGSESQEVTAFGSHKEEGDEKEKGA
jgi:hypothetical protein